MNQMHHHITGMMQSVELEILVDALTSIKAEASKATFVDACVAAKDPDEEEIEPLDLGL